MPGVRQTLDCSFSACRMGFRRVLTTTDQFRQIITFSFQCWQFVLCHRPLMIVIKDQYNVLCLGLSGSGKSTLLAQLVGDTTDNIEPTNGFNIKTLPIKDTVLSIKELGGSGRVQHFWDYYFADKNGLLFVVNSAANEDELRLARETLKTVLSNATMKGRPCLVLGTHSDLPEGQERRATKPTLPEHNAGATSGESCHALRSTNSKSSPLWRLWSTS